MGRSEEGLELAEARLELGVLAAERLELVLEAVGLALAGAAEIAEDLADAAADAAVEFAIELAVEGAARLGIAELAEAADDVDAQVGIGPVEHVLQRLASLAALGELGDGHDRRPATARGDAVARARDDVGHGALVAQVGEAVDGAGADDVGPRGAIEDVDQGVERGALARRSEGPSGLGLDEVARVAEGHALERLGRGGGAEGAERPGDDAPHLGVSRGDVREQRLLGISGAELTERRGGLGAHAPELFLVGERGREGLRRRRVVRLAEARRRQHAPARGGRMGELVAEQIAGRLELHLGEHRLLGVDDDEARARGDVEREGVRRLIDVPDLAPRGAVLEREVEGEVEGEERSGRLGRALPTARAAARAGLRLLDGHGADPLLELDLDVELGVTGAEDPLLEEALERASAHLFHGAHEIASLDDTLAVAHEVRLDPEPEQRVSELAAEHVKDGAALLVEVAIEDVDRRLVVLADDGALVAAVGLAEVRVHVALDAVIVLVAAEVGLAVDVLHEGGKTLVEPGVRPVTARDEIAKPLMGELVGDEVVGADVERGAVVEQDVLVHRRGGGVLHPAEDEVAHHHLGVLVPGVFDAGHRAEVANHLRGAGEGAFAVFFAPARDEVREGIPSTSSSINVNSPAARVKR